MKIKNKSLKVHGMNINDVSICIYIITFMIILLFFIIKIQTLLISKSKNFLIQNDTYALMNVSIARLNT
jgi:hypothetical protein